MGESYVLWLTSEDETSWKNNAYGYWAGKDYQYNFELFPVTDSTITDRTKIYSSKKRAENALKAVLNRNYAYVVDGKIEPYIKEVSVKITSVEPVSETEEIRKVKYAIYKGKVGLYARDYVDNMERLQNFMCRFGVRKTDLPIIVNDAGGRTSFYPIPDNFVEIIEIEETDEPLTREQMYPKNSSIFKYGWIDTEGNTYATPYEGHWRAAEAICKELGYGSYHCERTLEEKGWVKVTASWRRGNLETSVYVDSGYITKAQADKLIDLGLAGLWQVEGLIKHSADKW